MLTTPPDDIERDFQRLVDYRADAAFSQSYLKQFAGVKKPKTEDSLLKGNLIDVLVMTPYHFDNFFYVSDSVFPDFTLKFARWILMKTSEDEDFAKFWIDHPEEVILQAYSEFNYQPNWKRPTKLKHADTIVAAISMIIDSEGKQLITYADKQKATEIASRAVTFIKEVYRDLLNAGWTIHVQKDYRFKYGKHNCKCLLDFYLLSPDIDNPTIIPVDFKTTSFSLKSIHYQAQKIRYDFQAAFYTEGLIFNYPNAFIENFELIFYSSADDSFERIKLSAVDLLIGKFGMRTDTIYNINVEGNTVTRSKVINGFHQTFQLKHLDSSSLRKANSLNGNAIWT